MTAKHIKPFEFKSENNPGAGRPKGSRNRLAHKFVEALQADFEEHGIGAIRNCRKEQPTRYLQIIASVLPKEFEIVDNRLKDVPDEQLDAIVQYINGRLSERAERSDDGEEPSIN